MSANLPQIRISDYSYDLPGGRIAVYPLPERDRSKLLVWHNGNISSSVFSDIGQVLPENALLVFNNTRVIHARLLFRRLSGARIEVFCLEPHRPADYQVSFGQTGSVEWKCLVGNAKKWKHGRLELPVAIEGETVCLGAEMLERSDNAFVIRFSWDRPVPFAGIIEAAGSMPIPPYLNRPAEESDNDRYQTVYACADGSVAAPTAGLHFTDEVFRRLAEKKIRTAELTLHVGAGTFQPVKSDLVNSHQMHTETVAVSQSLLQQLMARPHHLIAIGTTSVRSLESLYWLGVKAAAWQPRQQPSVDQWEPYGEKADIPAEEALGNLLQFMKKNTMDELRFTTSLMIMPGYRFRLLNGMLTNFHQPRSTLLLLVAAFLGHDWKKVYDYALNNDFRFLSYGDSNLYLKD